MRESTDRMEKIDRYCRASIFFPYLAKNFIWQFNPFDPAILAYSPVDRLDRSTLTEGRVFTRLTIQWPFRLRSEF